MDTAEFARRYRDALFEITGGQRGIPKLEAERRYRTDMKYRTSVDILVSAAVRVLTSLEGGGEDYQEIFQQEANGLLNWD